MDTVRYVLAVLLLVTMPGAFIFWLVIHPFIKFWRRAGLWPAYLTGFGSMIVCAVLLYWYRDRLLGADFGTNWFLFTIGILIYAVGWTMERIVRRRLKFRTLVGVPEIKNDDTQQLITEGIYQLVRHPRYLTITVALIGFSLICNYLGVYVLLVITAPMLTLIAALEERELVQRFGQQYIDYQQQVPRIIPSAASLQRAFAKPEGEVKLKKSTQPQARSK